MTQPQSRPSEPSPEYQEYAAGSADLQKEFESRLFWLAGGAVTLVVAGTRTLSAPGPLKSPYLLVLSISALLSGLVATMVGLRVSAIMFNRYAEYWHDHDIKKHQSGDKFKPWVSALDWGAFVLVVAGLVCGGIFYLVNLLR